MKMFPGLFAAVLPFVMGAPVGAATPPKAAPMAPPKAAATAVRVSPGRVSPPALTTGNPKSAAYRGWKTCTLPTGLGLRLPPNWRVREEPDSGGLLLLPPGSLDGANESYRVQVAPADGITEATDPRLLLLAEQFAVQTLSAPLPSGCVCKTTLLLGGVPLLLADWRRGDGTNPPGNNSDRAEEARVRVYAQIQGGSAFILTGTGSREALALRDKTLRGIFASLHVGEGERDLRLLGEWQASGVPQTSTSERPSAPTLILHTDSAFRYRLQTDGTCWEIAPSPLVRARESTTLLSPITVADTATVQAVGDRETLMGRWYAGNGRFMLVLESGRSLTLGYRFDGDSLAVQLPDGTTQRWAARRP